MMDLMSYLPEWYRGSPETVAIQNAIQPELQMLWDARDDLLLQLNPNTATWGLAYWEKAFGLTTDENKDLAQRRKLVIAKIQGRETTTPALIKSLAEEILGVPVTVSELYRDYRVELCFDTEGQLPAGMDDLKEILDEIMPAHLVWDYLITITPTLYVGGNFTSCNAATLPMATEMGMVTEYPVGAIADENGLLLLDENGAILYEE